MTDRGAQFDLFGAPAPPPSRGTRASLYLALLPDAEARARIINIALPALARTGIDGREVKADRWHSTLFALGDGGPPPEALISSAQALAGSVRASAFRIVFDRFRLYAASGALVLANDARDSAAAQFNLRLFHGFKSAGLRPHGRSAEHITLMYTGAESFVDLLLPQPLQWEVRSFALVHSTTSRYETLASWNLG